MTTTPACCDSCGSTNETELAIACTLSAGDFKERVSGIRDLAIRSLVSSRRQPLRLELVYSREALDEVEDLVAKEADCCSFLEFDIQHDADGVRLTIAAPVEALAAADEIFAHFAPELPRDAA